MNLNECFGTQIIEKPLGIQTRRIPTGSIESIRCKHNDVQILKNPSRSRWIQKIPFEGILCFHIFFFLFLLLLLLPFFFLFSFSITTNYIDDYWSVWCSSPLALTNARIRQKNRSKTERVKRKRSSTHLNYSLGKLFLLFLLLFLLLLLLILPLCLF